MTQSLLLDTHTLHWWSAEPERLGSESIEAIEAATDLAIAAISWYELAWMARHERIEVAMPTRSWLAELSRHVRTVAASPAIADTAVALPSSFPGDPADRLIYATAIERGWDLVSKDRRMRDHRHPGVRVVW